ncbi:MAG TPA: tRNA uridine-5-carboxymethylaminomethyl(34) synthesis GTPase MnmE, partial [Rhodospirillaceae bacterium]|nr:tRNA uridine-5-carboxymethylaminomethyl(34) synthesis GTPase MnmE [Rhodospirillaceae bacterium]
SFLLRLQEWVSLKMDRGTAAPLTRARHRHALNDCVDAVRRAIDAPLQELAAQDLRLAARALGRITGRVDVEEILDVIFRDFCIGK